MDYSKKYYLENKEKIQAQQREYRAANKEKIKQQQKEYREAHMDEIKQKQKEYRNANADKIKQIKKRYNDKKKLEKQSGIIPFYVPKVNMDSTGMFTKLNNGVGNKPIIGNFFSEMF